MNWKNEAKEMLRKYDTMRIALINIPAEIKRLEIEFQSIRSSRTDGTPVDGGGSKREDAILNNIIERQELERALLSAELWVQSTERALEALSKEDQLILYRMYIKPEKYAVDRLSEEIGVDNSSIYRRQNRALRQFTIAFYGAIET